MKKMSILTLIASLAIISCVNDTEIVDNTKSKETNSSIEFSPFVGNSVKSENASIEALETGIMVYAFKTGETTNSYFNNSYSIFSKSKVGDYWISTPAYFWPQYALDFYGYYPPTTFENLINADDPTKFSFTVSDNGTNQVDLVAAFTEDQNRVTTIPMNFYHALSKVEFTINNVEGSGITLNVNSIGIRNITNTGEFEISKKQSIEDFFTVTNGTIFGDSVISTFATTVSIGPEGKDVILDSLYLMPQPLTPWAYSNEQAYPLTGSYIIINGSITGNADYTGEIAIPFTTEKWQPGYFYKYNIVFGDYSNPGSSSGGGGYNPNEPSNNPEDKDKPQQVLLPIKIDVTVENWTEVNEPNIIL